MRGTERWLVVELMASAAAIAPAAFVMLFLPRSALQNPLVDATLIGASGLLYLAIQFARRSAELKLALASRRPLLGGADGPAE
jgi:hypothetical protein